MSLSLLPTVKDPIAFKVLLYSGSLCQTSFTEYSYRPNTLSLVYALNIISVLPTETQFLNFLIDSSFNRFCSIFYKSQM